MSLLQPVVPGVRSRVCRVCQGDLRAGDLACPRCQTLVHGEQLDALSKEALALERTEALGQARERWTGALTLLPKGSTQAEWTRQHLRELEARLAAEAKTAAMDRPSAKPNWTKRLGPLAPAALLLAKLKGLWFVLLKLKFLLSFALFLGVYWGLFGPWFGVGFAVQILVHEMGHVFAVKRRGLKASMPVFLPGFGAYVRWQGMDVSDEVRAEIALAGPLFGLVAAAVCYGVFLETGRPVFAALAHAGAWLNLINLAPVWMLDGGQAAGALGRTQRAVLLAVCVAIFAMTHQGVFLLVGAGMVYRLFTRDMPGETSARTLVFYAGLLVLLGGLLHAIPLQPRGGF